MTPERRIVDNRRFLLGLDDLYREAMKQHEREELLLCAREVADVLAVEPANTPIEGYYAEDKCLTEYFRLMRSLQIEPKHRESELASVREFTRLKEVTTSLIFGPPAKGDFLLTVGEDALAIALQQTFPDWSINTLTNMAYQCALNSDDFSLVTLAALAKDPVVLAALRESVVLYAVVAGSIGLRQEPEYVWQVDESIQSRAQQFVSTFNDLFGESLPAPIAANANVFWRAGNEGKISGRCVRIGFNNSAEPIQNYHWAIDHGDNYELVIKDFWDADIWTTQRYRQEMAARASRL